MSSLSLTNADEITMRLVHYFIIKENYQPIVVKGLDNEIWLENVDKPYKVIRISNNYIHNNEQLEFDVYKTKSVVKQIRKKMLSFKTNTLNILLNVGDNVNIDDNVDKSIDYVTVNNLKDLSKSSKLLEIFPEIKNDNVDGLDDMDFFLNVTQDINDKTEEKNKLYEKTFKKKRIVVTYALIAINIIIYFLSLLGILDVNLFAMNSYYVVNKGEIWRIVTAMFFHGNLIHLFCNMYSLYVIGIELETVIGKKKFFIVYFISGIISSLLSGVVNNGVSSIGASGAIFGLMASLLYFGSHYRIYLSNIIARQLIPVIAINLIIGFMLPYIDNWAHIGGLVGGLFASMIVGIEGKTHKSDMINGIILTCILTGFLLFMLFR